MAAPPRKALYILPNLFTVSSIFCGIYALVTLAGTAVLPPDQARDSFLRAALAILGGGFLDGCDGRVARLTRTQSDFGVQLDSLADVITFGATPALLLYQWALSPLGTTGMLVAGLFAACGALRLARFNVMAARNMGGDGDFFTGLPIPLAAGAVVALVVAAVGSPEPVAVPPVPVACVTLLLSYLMVSTIPYRAFKKVGPRPAAAGALAVLAVGGAVAVLARPSLVLGVYAVGYIAWGLVERMIRGRAKATPAGLEIEVAGDEDTSDPIEVASRPAVEPGSHG